MGRRRGVGGDGYDDDSSSKPYPLLPLPAGAATFFLSAGAATFFLSIGGCGGNDDDYERLGDSF